MKYIEIQGLQKKVSKLVMGSGGLTPEKIEHVRTMLDAFVEIGGTTIDTAFIYSGGKAEQAIGMWIAERNNREDINIWTKGAHHDQNGPRVNKQAIYDELMISLERLQTDFVDMYALHRDDTNVPVGHIVEILNEHVEAGRFHAFGASNWTHQRLQEANDYASQHGLVGFSFNSPNLSLAKAKEAYWAGCISADADTCAWHEKTQMPLLSWSSQARGFFSGRFAPDVPADADMVRVFYAEDNWERLRRAEQLAKEKGVSPIQISLAYVLNQPFPACAIIGPANVQELHSCNEGAQIELTREELDWLDLIR
jgi:aryl-alcohol dehydrogenase-like predicted oxidoreductase